MLKGENATAARAVAHKLSVTDVEAEVFPEEVGKVVARLRAARLRWQVTALAASLLAMQWYRLRPSHAECRH